MQFVSNFLVVFCFGTNCMLLILLKWIYLNSILIDDRIDLKENWEAAGGIFIHHINTETTIRQLHELGVISEGQIVDGEDDWYWEGSWRLWRTD